MLDQVLYNQSVTETVTIRDVINEEIFPRFDKKEMQKDANSSHRN